MPDDADRATDEETAFREERLRRLKPRRAIEPAFRFCENCGERIPEQRRRAVPGTHRCMECQSELERRYA